MQIYMFTEEGFSKHLFTVYWFCIVNVFEAPFWQWKLFTYSKKYISLLGVDNVCNSAGFHYIIASATQSFFGIAYSKQEVVQESRLSCPVRHLSRPTLQMKTTKVFRQHCLSPLYIQNRQQLRIKQQGGQNLRKVKHRDGSGVSKHRHSITIVHNTT